MDTFNYVAHQTAYIVNLQKQDAKWQVVLNGETYSVEVIQQDRQSLTLRFGNRIRTFYTAVEGGKRWVAYDGCTYLVEKPELRAAHRQVEGGADRTLRAPMPSQVRDVFVRSGDVVEKGATLLLLEAMKMEIRIQAPRSGKITAVPVEVGQAVELDQILAEFEVD